MVWWVEISFLCRLLGFELIKFNYDTIRAFRLNYVFHYAVFFMKAQSFASRLRCF